MTRTTGTERSGERRMGGRDDRGETLSERTLPSMHTEATTGHRRPRTGTRRDDATRERADESHDMRRSVSGKTKSSLLGYAEVRRRKTNSSLLGYAEARRRKTKSNDV